MEALISFYQGIEIVDINDKNLHNGILDLKLKNKKEAIKLLNQGNGVKHYTSH